MHKLYKAKKKIYCIVLQNMLQDVDNKKLIVTGKQKSQIECLLWKMKK